MISCLDTQLLLESQYHYQEALLASQGENTPEPRYVPQEMSQSLLLIISVIHA